MANEQAVATKPQATVVAKPAAPTPAVAGAAPAKATKPQTIITTVTMSDKRVVEFPGKRKLQKESFIAEDGTLRVRLDFVNGETRTVKLKLDMIPKYALHGAEQKLGDEISGIEDVADCVEAVDQLIGRLDNGEWTVGREAGAGAGGSVLVRALVEFLDKPIDKIRAYLKDKTQSDKMALRTSVKTNAKGVTLKSIVDRLESEKTAKAPKVDTQALFDDLAKI